MAGRACRGRSAAALAKPAPWFAWQFVRARTGQGVVCWPQIHPPSFATPVQPSEAVKLCRGQLSEYELTEVADYKDVYFAGVGASKIRSSRSSAPNHG
jgi:hypothetical protein